MGRGWTILEAGNRGNVLMRSVGAQVYGDLSAGEIGLDNFVGEEYGPVQAPAGKLGAAMIKFELSAGDEAAYFLTRDNRSRRRFRWIDGRRGN
jgi:hypothetical protein